MIAEYFCEKCNYKTKRISDYNKHIKTKKHLRTYNNMWGCECGKKYKYDSGLSRHKKVCKKVCTQANDGEALSTDGALIKLVTTLVEETKHLKNIITYMIQKIGNNS